MSGDQNFLGLGIVFKGIDDGLDGMLSKINKGVSGFNQGSEILKKTLESLSFDTFSKKAGSAAEAMRDVQRATEKMDIGSHFDDAAKGMGVLDKRVSGMLTAFSPVDAGFGGMEDSMKSFGIEKDKIIANILLFMKASTGFQGANKDSSEAMKNTATDAEVVSDKMRGFNDVAQKTPRALDNLAKKFKRSATDVKGYGSVIGGLTKMVSGSFLANSAPIASFLTGSQDIPQYTKDWDQLGAVMGRVFDKKQVSDFMQVNLQNLSSFGVGAQDANQMASAMLDFGISAHDMSEVLPTMGALVGVMGINAQTVATMFGHAQTALKIMPNDMNNLVKKSLLLGNSYGLPHFVEQMPALIENVTQNMNKMGDVNEKSAQKSIFSLMRLNAMFQKTGLAPQEATAATGQLNNSLNDMERSIKRMNVGLDPLNDNIFELSAELSRVTGKGASETMAMITDGAKDQVGYVNQLIDIYGGLDEKSRFRFKEVIRSTQGDATANLLSLGKTVQDASQLADLKSKGKDPNSNFDATLDREKQTYDFKTKQLEASRELLKVEAQLAIKPAMLKTLSDQSAQVLYFAKAVSDSSSALGEMLRAGEALKTGGISTLQNLYGFDGKLAAQMSENAVQTEGFVKALLGLTGAAEGVFGAVVAGLFRIGGMFSLLRGMKGLGGGGGGGGGLFNTISGSISGILSKLPKLGAGLKVAAKWGGILGAGLEFASDYQDAKGDFAKGNTGKGIGTTLFGKATTGGAGDVMSHAGNQALKYGSIGATIGSIVPVLGPLIGGAIGAAFGAAGALIEDAIENNWFEPILKGIQSIWSSVTSWISKEVGNLGEFIGAVLGTSFKGWGLLKNIFVDMLPEGFATKVQSFFGFLGTMVDKIAGGFSGLTNAVSSFIKSFSFSNDSVVGKLFNGFLSSFDPSSATPASVASSTAPSGAPLPSAQMINNQISAPANAALGTSYMPTAMPMGSSNDPLINAVIDLKNSLQKQLELLASRPINVSLVGDAKKFFKAMSAESADSAGRMNLNNAVGG